MDIKQIITIGIAWVAMAVMALDKVEVTGMTARQRYPWNGLVDIVVTIQGDTNAIAETECMFTATNSATQAAVKVADINQVGSDTYSIDACTRRYLWNASNDVGAVKIDDLALTVNIQKNLGGVQLWENGPYWAECNVGATKPEEYGYNFWWGDTVGYKRNESNDGWVSVKDGTAFSFSPDNCKTHGKDNSALQAAGFIDTTGNLVAAYDAATVHLGEHWRMPTDVEFAALISNCRITLAGRNGVSGWLVIGKGAYASRSIFLPAAGTGVGSSLGGAGSYGFYWSSTPNSGCSNDAWGFYSYSTYCDMSSNYRYGGQYIRPLQGFAQSSQVADVAVGYSTHLKVDCCAGVRGYSLNGEILRYSTVWDGGTNESATVSIVENGTTLVEGLMGEGEQAWSVTRPGLYTLTHTTYTNSAVAKTLTAQFNVSGLPIDPAEIVVTPYDGVYDGAAHGLSVAGPEGTMVKYCATSSGVYAAELTYTDVCATQIWYEVSGGGWLAYTNSAALKISPRPVTITSGTKTDFVYDGQPHGFSVIIISENGFVAGEGIMTSNWAMVKTIAEGEVANTFDYAAIEGTKLSNYDITVVTGKIAVVKGTISGDGDEPGLGEVPEGGLSKFDAVRIYNGQGQTIDTKALVSAFAQVMVGEFTVEYAANAAGGGAPALPWTAVPPTIKDVGELVLWYRVTSPNYETFVHAVKVTVRPKTLMSDMCVADEDAAWFFDGTEKKPAVTVVDGDPNIATTNDFLLTYSGKTGAGKFPVTITGTNNYTGTVTKEFAILKRPVAPPIITPMSYNGKTRTPTVPTDSRWTVVSNPGGKNAGEYTNVVLRLTNTTDYKWKGYAEDGPDTWTGVFVIRKAANGWSAYPDMKSWTYGETPSEPQGRPRYGTLSVAYRTRGAAVETESSERPSEIGLYTARFWVEATQNYAGVASREVDFEIKDPNPSGATTTTPVPVPHSWLDKYVAEFGGDRETAGNATGRNGRPLWESYVAGLDPTDENSQFTATISIGSDGVPEVTWSPNLSDGNPPRSYTTVGKENLDDEAWTPVTDENRGTMKFFKVEVNIE